MSYIATNLSHVCVNIMHFITASQAFWQYWSFLHSFRLQIISTTESLSNEIVTVTSLAQQVKVFNS